MKQSAANPVSVPVTARVSPETKGKLEALARTTRRSEAALVTAAIEAYVDLEAWQLEQIQQGLDEVRKGVPGVPHEEVDRWLASWGTSHELPPPKPKT